MPEDIVLPTAGALSQDTLAAVALGSNLPSRFGDPAATVEEAIRRVGELGRLASRSRLRRTAPVGYLDQPLFTNAALLLETTLNPHDLMRALLRIEQEMGRRREGTPAKGPRIIDLDLLLFGNLVLESDLLTLPHPALAERLFVLEPLAEIAPGIVHPVLRRTAAELLLALEERSSGFQPPLR